PISIPAKTLLYRNRDKDFDDKISHASPERKIRVKFLLQAINCGATLTATDERGLRATNVLRMDDIQRAKTPQEESRRRVLSKLGDTNYSLSEIIDKLGDCFIPASVLANLRRDVVTTMDTTAKTTYNFRYRKTERFDEPLPSPVITVHDNVANHLAREFYLSHGAKEIASALEISSDHGSEELHVMTTRYCLRRELGACLLDSGAGKLPKDLYLVAPGMKLHLVPDCSKCMMNIYHSPQKNNKR
ncbi:MAG: DUF3656 domain-containing protein, partial [Duncaniella sp.]|nr:DUF3656 domain-containing protein [Duncaniella sp.]